MSIVIIDYPLPESVVNRTDYEGKFLQLRWRGREYLVFAPLTQHRYHNQLLAHFLAEHAIPHHWLNQETLKVEAPELTVSGGGRFRVNTLTETLRLWDNSQAYGRFEENGLPDKIAGADHPWSGYEVIQCSVVQKMGDEHASRHPTWWWRSCGAEARRYAVRATGRS